MLNGEILNLTAAEWKILLFLSSNGGYRRDSGTNSGPLFGIFF